MRYTLPLLITLLIVGPAVTLSVRGQTPRPEGTVSDRGRGTSCIVIYGAVHSPARLELQPDLRLADGIAMVGGLTDRAGKTIQIIHSGLDCFVGASNDHRGAGPVTDQLYFVDDLERGDHKANPYLLPGDIVLVAELAPIYVTGSVGNPRAIFPKETITVTRALALAGGTLRESTNTIRVYRQAPGSSERTVIKVDLKKAKKVSAMDLLLQPYDIVEVVPKGQFSSNRMRADWF
jgi:polysaccharide export outer membrane protein